MTKRMLIDATHAEETRVAIVDSYRDNNRLEDLDFGLASKPILRGNIYLAKVMRVEPSLQAAFVEYGGNRHGFLPFSEIHPDYFRIPMADRPEGEEEDDMVPEEMIGEDDQNRDTLPPDEDIEPQEQSAFPAQDVAPDGTSPHSETEETAPVPPPLPLVPTDGFTLTGEADVGLITDFGNAAIPMAMPDVDPSMLPPTPIESIGGEMAERVVRQHRPRYKIQEVLKRGQVMLIQVVKEERGNKGAALTSFLSLAGRYCVLMPNTDHGGGVSRKITNHQDRRRLKEILDQLEIPEGMAVILRTAGMEQDPPEIQRDLEYLLRLWDSIREQTLQSTAPSLIYEEANLIKRSVRDLYTQDIAEILVAGEEGYNRARDFMRTIMPDEVEKIKLYNDPIPLFFRFHVENQIDSLHSPVVQLRSGGYLVINPTEALVAIDVNSGRATRERHIEETAVKTNLEAADEVARQLRLRDLAGLVVIDFIDMEDNRNNNAVERRLKEAMKNDRARLQIGRISPFGLMELSRQRLRPSLVETNFEKCPHCAGSGYIRSIDSAALSILRVIEEEGIKQRSSELILHVATKIALYILNQKREALSRLEQRYNLHVLLHSDDSLVPPDHRIERLKTRKEGRNAGPAVNTDQVFAEVERELPPVAHEASDEGEDKAPAPYTNDDGSETNERHSGRHASRFRGKGRHDRRYKRGERGANEGQGAESLEEKNGNVLPIADESGEEPNFNTDTSGAGQEDSDSANRRRRRGRRGGRRRGGSDRQPNTSGEGQNHNNPRRDHPRPQRSEGSPVAAPYAAPVIPMSIHDIDTTPKPVSQEKPRQAASYEVVNPPSDKPKGGWWRRLTGQED